MSRKGCRLWKGIGFLIILVCCINSKAIAKEFGANYDIVVLQPDVSRTIEFELDDVFLSDYNAFHATYIICMGNGVLSISVESASHVEKGDIVFAILGMIAKNLIFDWDYASTGEITQQVSIEKFAAGVLFTSILYRIGSPDLPVNMSMSFKFISSTE